MERILLSIKPMKLSCLIFPDYVVCRQHVVSLPIEGMG